MSKTSHTQPDSDRWMLQLCREERLPDAYAQEIKPHLRDLAQWVQDRYRAKQKPLISGISGAQGSGKTTFSRFLQMGLKYWHDLQVVILSLDDIYLTITDRQTLARDVHPLLVTRGVPGTHDTDLGLRLLRSLTNPTQVENILIPRFNKKTDDRYPESQWFEVTGPVDIVLFEGWCVGATPQTEDQLGPPVNLLEASEDPSGIWRRYVNARLAQDYAKLFEMLDVLILLRIPSFDEVYQWRLLQEQKLITSESETPGLSSSESAHIEKSLHRFIQHYERLTRHMLDQLPGVADCLIDIDEKHGISRIQHRH